VSLSDLASLGSFVSGIAVLVSLVFLYFQIRQVSQQVRQGEKNQQAAIRQARITRAFDWHMGLVEPAVADVWRRGLEGSDLSATELAQFTSIVRALFLHAEDSFFQHKEGLLNEAAFVTFSNGFGGIMRHPGARAAWKALSGSFNPEMAVFMSGLLAKSQPSEGYLLSPAHWTPNVARERELAAGDAGERL
jgi:hypothetical protein